MSNEYVMPDGFGRHQARHPSRYKPSQPRYQESAKPMPPRQRYRATQSNNPMYDVVEDDQYSQDEHFDTFDRELLQHKYRGVERQPVLPRPRLSLAPGPSRIAATQVHYQDHGLDRGEYEVTIAPNAFERSSRGQLDRFAYRPTQPSASSSDIHFNPSSPALKASERREAHNHFTARGRMSKPLALEIEQGYAYEEEEEDMEPFQHVRPIKGEVNEVEEQLPVAKYLPKVSDPCQQPFRPKDKAKSTHSQGPIIQGIRLVPVSTLPDRLRGVFPFPAFNAVQSKCFQKVFQADDNFVLASPTGSGKTAILELGICRAVATNATGQYKVVYQAPTKALCSERQRDWEVKFQPLGLKCAELTGDSDANDLRNVQSANIIITTPEKWDSITRKWKDHDKLMKLVKLFLIDEVHILKENRGAVLEVVVSRMKSIGIDVRFIALSATVPNVHDVAAWLGKSPAEPFEPATVEKFGEEFRPVQLTKHVCGYTASNQNDFAFDKMLDSKLPEVIAKFSERKPIMIFCATRSSSATTAKSIAQWWSSNSGRSRFWDEPSAIPAMVDKDLRTTIASGVAFHHAGLTSEDRMQVERGFLQGDIAVICCTSTLAVGVNLPCHLVIIKNTLTYTIGGLQEYSDLEMMQMLGRAGRPQFDDSAVAVILTRQAKVRRYEMMATSHELLESKLHLNLVDHLNAEICLGTIWDLPSARKWLTGTFLFVRLQQNPNHYKLEGATCRQSTTSQVDEICSRDITLLQQTSLVSDQEHFRCTEFGLAMARYYVHFETMKVFMGLHHKSSPSEILSAIAQASEFSNIRFRQGEKAVYKILNKSPSIRWSIPVNLDLPAQKVSLIIQSVLGCADISWEGEMAKHRSQFVTDTQLVFKSINSLARCIIDCQISLGDSIGIHSALLLERSLGSKAWDDSPLQMRQIENIGVVAVRKLVNAGIRSMDDLEACDATRIETLVNRNPPFGLKILEKVRMFPKLHVSLHANDSSIAKRAEGVTIQVKADIGFLNEKPPQRFANKLVYVCVLAETSDGRKSHFARISGQMLASGQTLAFAALLTSADQCINCYVMCEGIAGTMRMATVKPRVIPSMFSAATKPELVPQHKPNVSRRRVESLKSNSKQSAASEDFGDDGIDDEELMKVTCGGIEFECIENYPDPAATFDRNTASKALSKKDQQKPSKMRSSGPDDPEEPVQLPNGKWACNHRCKDRNACKHLCCKEGMDNPPKKKPATKRATLDDNPPSQAPVKRVKGTQTKLQLTPAPRKPIRVVESLDLTEPERGYSFGFAGTNELEYPGLASKIGRSTFQHQNNAQHRVQDLSEEAESITQPYHTGNHDLLDLEFDDTFEYPEYETYPDIKPTAPMESSVSDVFGDDDSLLGDAMIGLADSQNLQTLNEDYSDRTNFDIPEDDPDVALEEDYLDDDFSADLDVMIHDDGNIEFVPQSTNVLTTAAVEVHDPASKSNPVVRSIKTLPSPDAVRVVKTEEDRAKRATNSRAAVPMAARGVNVPQHRNDLQTHGKTDLENTEDSVMQENQTSSQVKPDAEGLEGIEPWLLAEFGDIIEITEA